MACSLFGMSAIGRFHCNDKNMKTRKIIPYRTILITGLWLVRKVNILLWVYKTGKTYLFHSCQTHLSFISFMPDTPFLLLFTVFSNARFFNFLLLKYIYSAERCISPPPPSWYPPFLKKEPLPPFLTTIMEKY